MVEINLIKDIVFFSSTFRDFQEARQKILLGFQNLDIKVEAMEHFDASSTPIKEECLHRLEESQVYLLVVGEMYGSIDSETKLSYTELEYNRAVELKQQNKIKDIWVFKPTNKYEPLPEHIEIDDVKKDKLKTFREKVCVNHTPQHYDNLDDLRAKIYGRCYNALREIAESLMIQSGMSVEGIRQSGRPEGSTVKFVHEQKPLTLSIQEKEKLAKQINEMNKILKAIGKDELKTDFIDVKSVTLIGNYYYVNEQFDESIKMYDLVLKDFPDDTRALNNKGSALRGEKNREEAAKLWRRAIELDPNYTDPIVNLGGVLCELGNPKEALQILDPVYKKEIDNADMALLLNLGLAHSKIGNFEIAHDFYKKAENKFPKEIQILNNIMILYQSENDFKKAIEYADKIINLESHNTNALTSKGSCYLEMGNFILGLHYLNQSLKQDPNELVTLINLALCYRRMHEFGIMKRWYADWVELYAKKSLDINENDFMALDHLGWVMNRCERYNDAFELLDKALKLKPDHTGILLDKVDGLLRIDKSNEALIIIDHIIELEKPMRDEEVLRIKYNLLLDMKKQSDAELFIKDLENKLSPEQIEHVKKRGKVFVRKPKI